MATGAEVAAAVIAALVIFRRLGPEGEKFIRALQGVTESDVRAQIKAQHDAVKEFEDWINS